MFPWRLNMEYLPLPTIIFFGLLVLFGYILPKWEREGYFLKKEVKPYYNKLLFYLEPYINTDFGKRLNQKAIDLLNYTYKWNKSLADPRDDDVYKLIIDNRNNNDYVYSFAWLFLYSHIGDITNEESIEFPLASKIRKCVKEEKDTLPQELIDFFEIRLY